MTKKEFDRLADTYKQSISPWMKITGENIEFYAWSRIKWAAKELKKQNYTPHRILDFGCGVGLATPYLLKEFGDDCTIIGVDVSLESLKVARSKYASKKVNFYSPDDYTPDKSNDLAFCNGVFHHIPPDERNIAARYVHDSLKPGGFFVLWENNPWNPIMNYNMAHADIDRNAIPIVPPVAKQMVSSTGFALLKVRYRFLFPNFLRFLRVLETSLSQIPIGAQYVILSRKDEL